MMENGMADVDVDVLIVGAGPTGLMLAAQLERFGARFRIVDRAADRAHESRALAVQARTLELLDALGLADALVERGNPGARLRMILEGRLAAEATLGDFAGDTRFPYILFVSQAETEALLGDYLAARGVRIERRVEMARFADAGGAVECVLRAADGREERVRARWLAGCDGAHSPVRKGAGIDFRGGAYLQRFMLGDVEADGALVPDTLNAFVRGGAVAIVFPLGRPTTWRVIATSGERFAERADGGELATEELELDELQSVVSIASADAVTLRDPAWLADFRLHHRQAARYSAGRVFLAGDAAHIHSPVGGQGMNTGMQDAWSLGWKLALVARGQASPAMLETYGDERMPVGRVLLRSTDRAFSLFMRGAGAGRLARWIRRNVAGRVLPRVLGSRRLRARAFRFVSELAIRYRHSPAVEEGEPRLHGGPRAGDRLPDARVALDGRETRLHAELAAPGLHLLLCGDPAGWDGARVDEVRARCAAPLAVHHLAAEPAPGVLADAGGEALARLAVRDDAQYLVRPDGHVAFRCAGRDLAGLEAYLRRWFSPPVAG
ncbi:MAG TPA: FAD-dependent monooxygenase [Longimicrobiaceae bacterium]